MAFVMMKRDTAGRITDRLKKIGPDTQRLWGKMQPVEIIAHLRRNVEISLGEVPVKDASVPVVRTLLRWFIFHLAPTWPKGKIKAPPIFLAAPEGDFASEREKLLQSIDRFVEAEGREPSRIVLNPFLGPLPLSYWARIHGKHFDHHLRQFGV